VISLCLNVHAWAEWGESDDSKDSFRWDKNKFFIILLNSVENSVRRFEQKIGEENISKSTIWNFILYDDDNGNGFRIVNYATSK